jgi:hypothetical protein
MINFYSDLMRENPVFTGFYIIIVFIFPFLDFAGLFLRMFWCPKVFNVQF